MRQSKHTGKPYGVTCEDLHYWYGTGDKLIVSHEYELSRHTLWSFEDVEECVNYLFLNGFKQSAREINQAHKQA